jgi:hypothetical protein
VERIGDGQIRIVPDFLVTGAGNSGNGLVDALLAVVLQNQVRSNTTPNQVIAAPDEAAN